LEVAGADELDAAALLSVLVAGVAELEAEVAGAAADDCAAVAFWSGAAAEDEASEAVAGWLEAAALVLVLEVEALELLQVSAMDFTLFTL